MAPLGSQDGLQRLQQWVTDNPAWAVACVAAAYPAALLLRPLLLASIPYVLLVVVLAAVR